MVHVLAAIIAGAWVYQNFVLFRESAWNVQLSQQHETIELSANKRLLCLDICLKNIGKVDVQLNVGNKEGLVASVGIVPRDTKSELIDDPSVQLRSVLSEDVGYKDFSPEERGEDAWKWINVLRYYRKYYVLEPGVEYHEREYVVVDANSLIYTRVCLTAVDGKSIRDSKVTKIE